MKNKFSLVTIITAVCVVLAVFGVSTLAKASTAPLSSTVNGTLHSVSADQSEITVTVDQESRTVPLAQNEWVSRNGQKALLSDLKTGDKLEIILNNKNQAAFIKAASPDAAPAASAQPQQTAAPTPASTAPTATPSASPSPTPTSTPATASPGATPAGTEPQMLDVKIDGPGFRLMLKHNPGQDGENYRLMIKVDGSGTVHLKGEEAGEWIRDLLSAVGFTGEASQAKLLQAIAQQFGLDESKLSIDLKVKWPDAQPAATASPAPAAAPAAVQVELQKALKLEAKDDKLEVKVETQDDDSGKSKPANQGKDDGKKQQGKNKEKDSKENGKDKGKDD